MESTDRRCLNALLLLPVLVLLVPGGCSSTGGSFQVELPRSLNEKPEPGEGPPAREKTVFSPDLPSGEEKGSRPQLGPSATLDDYRLHAALHNPGLEALYHQWRAASERAPQARSLPEPVFSFTEFLVPVETRTGPQEAKFQLSQSFPWFGKLKLRGTIEEEGAGVAWQRFLAAQLVLDHRLRTTYAEYYYLARSITITRTSLDLLVRLERVARQDLAAGVENHPDVIRLQVELGMLEDRLKSLLDWRKPLLARLNSILNRPAETEVPWPGELPRYALELDTRELLDLVTEHNPELVALQHEITRALLEEKLARKEYYPDFSVGIETIATGEARAPNTVDSGDNPWMITFGLKLPIWYSKYRAGSREAEARRLAARHQHADLKNQLLANLEEALYHLRDSERRVSLYENTQIPKAEESMTAIEAAFRAGSADFLDLIESQRSLLEFQLARERALSDRLQAQAKIDRLLGRYVLSPPQQLKEATK